MVKWVLTRKGNGTEKLKWENWLVHVPWKTCWYLLFFLSRDKLIDSSLILVLKHECYSLLWPVISRNQIVNQPNIHCFTQSLTMLIFKNLTVSLFTSDYTNFHVPLYILYVDVNHFSFEVCSTSSSNDDDIWKWKWIVRFLSIGPTR